MEEVYHKIMSAETAQMRSDILKDALSKHKKNIERWNGVEILTIDEYSGLRVGDKVQYTNIMGKVSEGYVSHFSIKRKGASLSGMVTELGEILAMADDRALESPPEGVTPVMFSTDTFGYATHHGLELPRKIN